jgi:hypothetical protein
VCIGHRPVGPGGGWRAKSHGWPTNFYVGSDQNFMETCLHEKGKVKKVKKFGGGQTHWPASHHLVSYWLGQVGGAPPLPYKYPPTGGN